MKKITLNIARKFTAWERLVIEIEAKDLEDAKSKLLKGEEYTIVDQWDVNSDDYQLTEPETWEIENE